MSVLQQKRPEGVPGNVPSRLRRISLLPKSITSASLSNKSRPTSGFAPPTSSPAREIASKSSTVSSANVIKRRISSSNLPVPSSTLSSFRRANISPDKGKAITGEKPNARSPPFVSEFGTLKSDSSAKYTVASPHVNKPQPRSTISGQVTTSIRQSSLLPRSSRSSLRPSTAVGKPSTGESFPLRTATVNNLPRPRIGSSTPTRSSISQRQNGLVKAVSTVAMSSSPSFQLKPLVPLTNAALASSKSTYSIKSRAAVFERFNASTSSPSPLPRQKIHPQSTPTQKFASTSRPASMLTANEVIQQSHSKPLLSRTGRTSMKPQAQQVDPVRSRRSSLVAVQPPAITPLAVTAPVQPESTSKPSPNEDDMDDSWGRWKAGTPAQCDEKITIDEVSQGEEDDSRGSLSVNDFINASMLLDGKMLDELDAEVGRLGLNESTTVVDVVETKQGFSMQLEEERRKRDAMMEEMIKQRDDAIYHETQMEKELEAAMSEVEEYKAVIKEAARQAQNRKEMTTQTEMSEKSQLKESTKEELKLLQRHAEKSQASLTVLELEAICQQWKHATDLACNHLDTLESQTDICSYLYSQLDMFAQSILQCKC